MKIFSAEQIRAWDEYTIREEPITSDLLMERAARQCHQWIQGQFPNQDHFTIVCGKGNNGGDGMAIARMLAHTGKTVQVHVLEFGYRGTPDFQLNLSRLHQYPGVTVRFIQQEDQLPHFEKDTLLIDALYGSGLNRPLQGLSAALVDLINRSNLLCIAIDLPSGLYADRSSVDCSVVRATHTLCLHTYKLAMMMAENAPFLGKVHLLNIGLDDRFERYTTTTLYLQQLTDVQTLVPQRNDQAHKGTFGHALLICGSKGKMGAAVLAAQGALRSGLGLLTCSVPGAGYDIIQSTVPEAMARVNPEQEQQGPDPGLSMQFDSIGIGPGLGVSALTVSLLRQILPAYQHPLVLDADALNILAAHPALLSCIPVNSVLTPHPLEFERLFGRSDNEFERMQKALEKARELRSFIVLKGHRTLIACPDGDCFFNGSGNPGMATGGTGDVLTGILTGLLAQAIPPEHAVRLGVYLHGLAGNLAAAAVSEPALLPSDLIRYVGSAWLSVLSKNKSGA